MFVDLKVVKLYLVLKEVETNKWDTHLTQMMSRNSLLLHPGDTTTEDMEDFKDEMVKSLGSRRMESQPFPVVEVKVMNKQNGSSSYKPGQPNYLKRHVNHLILLVPVEEEDEGHADGQLPDVPAQAVQEVHDVSAQSVKEVHDQNDVAAATTQQPRSASQDFNEEHSQVPRQEDDEALTQPCQVDEELGGECSRGRRKTTRVTRSTAAARH